MVSYLFKLCDFFSFLAEFQFQRVNCYKKWQLIRIHLVPLASLQYFEHFWYCMFINFLQKLILEVMKMDEIKFTSSSVWEKRENPGKYWNGKEW